LHGNGVTISGGGNARRIFCIGGRGAAVGGELIVDRVHFTNVSGVNASGGAILSRGKLTARSCIFSNLDVGTADLGSASSRLDHNWSIGGAISHSNEHSTDAAITVSGCTFVNNKALWGGAVVIWNGSSNAVKFIGNLFYNNTATSNQGHTVWTDTNTGTNPGSSYNVWDKSTGSYEWAPSGTGNYQNSTNLGTWVSGYTPTTAGIGDASNRLNRIPSALADFPSTDFYGQTRNNAANGTVGAIKPIQYSVKYNGNSNTGGAMATNSTHIWNAKERLTLNAFTRTGYTFKGWSTVSGANNSVSDNPVVGGKLTDSVYVSNLVTSATAIPTAGQTVQLYAVWQPITYTVKYNTTGSTGGTAPADRTHTYDASQIIDAVPASLVKTGHTCLGWNQTSTATTATYPAAGETKTSQNLSRTQCAKIN
jgi:uncharacterized repeat protein (TIGR02543 family)